MQNQRCKACGRRDKFNFVIEADTWERVVPKGLENRVVCISCFDSFASEKGIQWLNAIEGDITFAGDMASFSLKIGKDSSEPEIA